MPRCVDCGATTPTPPDHARHLTPLCPIHYAARGMDAHNHPEATHRIQMTADAARDPDGDGTWYVRMTLTIDEYVCVRILWPAMAVEMADAADDGDQAATLRQAATQAAHNNASGKA
jgi:hypothetical protein